MSGTAATIPTGRANHSESPVPKRPPLPSCLATRLASAVASCSFLVEAWKLMFPGMAQEGALLIVLWLICCVDTLCGLPMKIREWRVKGGQVNVSKRIEGQEIKRTEIKLNNMFSNTSRQRLHTTPQIQKYQVSQIIITTVNREEPESFHIEQWWGRGVVISSA